jgi:hypothetical protein
MIPKTGNRFSDKIMPQQTGDLLAKVTNFRRLDTAELRAPAVDTKPQTAESASFLALIRLAMAGAPYARSCGSH